MNIYIWGTGVIAKEYSSSNEISKHLLLGYIESKKTKKSFNNRKVCEPEDILETEYDYIIVCVMFYSEQILQRCAECGISLDKIILIDRWKFHMGEVNGRKPFKCCEKILENQNEEFITKEFPELYEKYIKKIDMKYSRYIVISRNGYDLIEKNLLQTEEYNVREYQNDYFRYRTFELTANEIIKNQVEGDVAEVGVFRGTFAKLINEKFSDKKIYLFDTFESFNKVEFEREVQLGRSHKNLYDTFLETSEEYVKNRMPYKNKCIIKKGLFPKTAEGLENLKFAFVSIDVDFEDSIYEALKYFYPRLQKGGAIFVHDYNNWFLEGVKIAVSRYEKEIGFSLIKLPLADEGGTLVVLK